MFNFSGSVFWSDFAICVLLAMYEFSDYSQISPSLCVFFLLIHLGRNEEVSILHSSLLLVWMLCIVMIFSSVIWMSSLTLNSSVSMYSSTWHKFKEHWFWLLSCAEKHSLLISIAIRDVACLCNVSHVEKERKS